LRSSLVPYRDLLTRYLRPQARRVAILAALLCGSIGLQIANPQILRHFIDTAMAPGSHQELTFDALLYIGIAVGQQLLLVASTYISELVGWTATNELRADLTLHLLELDLSFHKSRTPGELIERIDGDVTTLANFFSQFVVKVLGSLLLLLGVLIVLWMVSPLAGVVVTLFAACILVGMLRLRTIAVPYWTADRQASADLFGFIEERLAGTVDIRSSGARSYVMRRLYEFMRARYRAGSTAIFKETYMWSVPVTGFAVGTALAFALAAYLVRTASLSLGTGFLIYFYMQLLFEPLNLLSNQVEDFQKANAGIIRIRELLQIRSAISDGPGASFPDGAPAVEFRGVCFGYEDEEMILHDLSFSLDQGAVLGLLGRTGSGKTTLTRLLCRLYDPSAGAVLLGGIDLRTARLAEVRRHVGMVTQDVQLFRATVRDNLTFFDPTIDDVRIVAALTELGLDAWLRGLPEGLDTMLAAGGGGLSAGEAQLLAFTRVFLKNPGLVILDEASSRLDPATERLIEHAIGRLLEGRTGIVIAHRLATVQRADLIMILEGGHIAEYGLRDRLMGDAGSRFSGLLRAGVEEVLV
jgi:ABC-type multidrug transport system fused ATPase/permease subunit